MSGNSPRRLGQGMLFVAALGVLGGLTWFFDGALDRQRNPNQNVSGELVGAVRQVVLDANRQHHYLATAEINGEPVEVMVDTGASQVAISATAAARLGLPRGQPALVSTANGTARVESTRIDRIRLGTIELRDVAGVVVPNMDSPEVLLGMSFLRELELTQRDGQLILRQNGSG
ncbi:MAG: TIGR02281 family clan AA aspartic protease [Pseudomonadota bacterium]